MQIRVMGSRQECDDFAAMIRAVVPKQWIRGISDFYPNRGYGTDGRIYVTFRDMPDGTMANLPAVCGNSPRRV